GSSSHGKLKADQWRSAAEFNLPVALIADLWDLADAVDDVDREQCLSWSNNTMNGMVAVNYATFRRTSAACADKYTIFMKAYIDGLKTLFPEFDLRLNHHLALHLGKLLKNLGPVHGWWVFPFEHIVGVLQQVNTNPKLGM
ncbi:hypothetical protein JAAARDRAFT_100053, partial [Jaapia argillacea MUCL 33604]